MSKRLTEEDTPKSCSCEQTCCSGTSRRLTKEDNPGNCCFAGAKDPLPARWENTCVVCSHVFRSHYVEEFCGDGCWDKLQLEKGKV
jgi:hypothetical protein